MNQAFHLYRLQQIDTQIDQVESALAEIERRLSGDDTVRQAIQTAENAAKTLHTAQQQLKKAEVAVRDQQIKIAQSESNLYSGRLHNPKELQDLQKDIASLKKYLAVLEDKQLEAMIANEEAEAVNTSAIDSSLAAQAAFSEKSAGWVGQKEQLSRTLERLRAERQAALTPVSAENIKIYDTMRKRKNGVAVTTIKDGACAICGGTIRPSETQTARSAQEFVYCASCGRIFYAG